MNVDDARYSIGLIGIESADQARCPFKPQAFFSGGVVAFDFLSDFVARRLCAFKVDANSSVFGDFDSGNIVCDAVMPIKRRPVFTSRAPRL